MDDFILINWSFGNQAKQYRFPVSHPGNLGENSFRCALFEEHFSCFLEFCEKCVKRRLEIPHGHATSVRRQASGETS